MVDKKDASTVMLAYKNWWPMYEEGRAEYFQGEPGASEAYSLPGCEEMPDVPVANIGLCIVHTKDPDEWYLVPARKGVDAWEIAAAYIRLGYFPPLVLINQLTHSPRTSDVETQLVLRQYRSLLQDNGSEDEKAILMHIRAAINKPS